MHSHTPTPPYAILSRLWLHEPDANAIARAARELSLASAAPAELAVAYADLFLLNVYPYASVFLDPDGEMNGTRAQEMRDVYEQNHFAPAALSEVGAPDHVGLMLGLLDHANQDDLLPYLLDWAPVLCLAVEREPTAHPFYRTLAQETRRALFARLEISNRLFALRDNGHTEQTAEWPLSPADPDEEISLRAVVRWLLSPARSGVFISRARLGLWARQMGLPLPFGERFQIGLSLWEAAGLTGQAERLLDWLHAEVSAWDKGYAAWAAEVPAWAAFANPWRGRTAATTRMLSEMRAILRRETPAQAMV